MKRRRGKKLILAFIAAVLLLVGAWVAYTWVPVWFHLPVQVTVNGKPYKVKSGTQFKAFLSSEFDLGSFQGLVKADTGQVLDPKGGKPVQIMVDSHPLRPRERIMRGGNIVTLARGADIVHKTELKPVAIPQKAVMQGGNGRLISLLRAGRAGTLLQCIDTVTGKVLSSDVATPAVDTLMQAYTSTGIAPKVVALTFDDGPHTGYTEQILAILAQQKAKATFFELGINIKKYPALSKASASNGNLVGLHSWDHTDFTKINADQIKTQLQDAQSAFKAASGHTTTWVRPPYGATTTPIDGQITTQGLKMAFWTVDTKDWNKPGADKIASAAINGARPGAIILMHDGGGDRSQTVAALPKIITTLRAQGYSFVTVDELYRLSGGK